MRTIAFAVAAMIAFPAVCSAESAMDTRFGKLEIDSNENILLLNKKPTSPKVAGNSGLSIEKVFAVGDKDVVLVMDIGGTVCPGSWGFLTLSKSGIEVSSSFGTCSDILVKAAQDGGKITLSMPKTAKKNATYVFENGAVAEDGKPVKGTRFGAW